MCGASCTGRAQQVQTMAANVGAGAAAVTPSGRGGGWSAGRAGAGEQQCSRVSDCRPAAQAMQHSYQCRVWLAADGTRRASITHCSGSSQHWLQIHFCLVAVRVAGSVVVTLSMHICGDIAHSVHACTPKHRRLLICEQRLHNDTWCDKPP
jgi:hypothetical protein